MGKYVEVKCPECGIVHIIGVIPDTSNFVPKVMVCETSGSEKEDRGCGSEFAYKFKIKLQSVSYRLTESA